ncbi:MAG TPA: hypothetical protein VGV61_00915, partial [Thermoanaerobaculia bacterium]|nr:hypothetical protein [Thermoanaerobaculia bacterium]
ADRRTALLAAFLLGCSHWAARSGRTGWDAVLLVALQLAALACLAKARRFRTLPPALAGGGLLGASLYTYVAARLAVLQAVVWLAWEAFAARRRRAAGDDLPAGPPRALAQLALCVGGMVAVAGPFLLRLWLLRPELLTVRVAELSVFARHGAGEPWLTLGRNLLGHLLMFHVRGGAYARDALPGFPMLDPITGALLLAGLVVVALAGDWRRRLLLSWPLVMVLGGVLSTSGEGPPFPYRVSSLAPWSCLVAALGGVALWDAATGSFAATPRRRLLARGIAAVALAAVVVINGWALLVAWPADPGTRRAFGTTPTRVGRWLAVHRAGRPTLILRGALRPPALPAGYPYAAANRTDFFREGDAVAAVQLAAGLYRAHPARALAPLLPGGDVDFATALPGALAAPTLLVMAPERAAEATRRFAVAARWELRDDGKGPLVTILLAQP